MDSTWGCVLAEHMHSRKRTGKSKTVERGPYQLPSVLAGGYKSVLPQQWVITIEEGRVDQLHGAIERMLRIPPCASELPRGI